MSAHFERAKILIQQSRYELAEKELRQELAVSPENSVAHALLAFCLAKQKKYKEATREAQLAVHLTPDLAYCHYILGSVLDDQDRLEEAEAAVREAIRIDPEDADYFALLGNIQFQQRQWSVALGTAEQGLRIDPEHIDCINLRAMALVKLGRKQEAGTIIDTALAKDPENAVTYANKGWSLLEQGDHSRAMEYFREALRLDPQFEWAREGIVEALKARRFVYRLMLRYFFWMSRLSRKAQWGFILGGFIVFRILALFLGPLVVLYFIFVLLSWIADPLFNLLLRLDRLGRLALSREQVIASNWVGVCILAALLGLSVFLLTRSTTALLATLGCGAMVLPVSGTFKCRPGRGRKILAGYTILLLVMGFTTLGLFLTGSPHTVIPTGFFLLGWLLFTWIANIFIIRD